MTILFYFIHEFFSSQSMKKYWINFLIVGMAFGTAWAIRGQFGHEQGAAWAGGIGALALVLVAGRKDWNAKALLISLASAVGWGAGGMISYGQIVGYGRSDDFLNASYGLLMLFIIGGLYGLTGGGLVGLSLSSTKKKKVEWVSLITKMTAGGIITYYFLVEQLGLLMTPPRSEAWAVCLGAGVAMVWFMARHQYTSALRVALISALGAGFGFAFGNFLQILGNIMEIQFNMWNVMEYSIGFFGGVSMAYGVFSTQWPEESETAMTKPWEGRSAFFIVFVLIPLLVFQQSSALLNPLLGGFSRIQQEGNATLQGSLAALFILIIMVWLGLTKMSNTNSISGEKRNVRFLFILYFVVYMIFSYIVSGAFKDIFMLNHHLYVVNLVVILFLVGKHFPAFPDHLHPEMKIRDWFKLLLALVLVILFLSLISVLLHGEMSGSNNRF
ncbi:MAG: hypothetical protein AB2L20_32345 [Mangrovibacterium sp.]